MNEHEQYALPASQLLKWVHDARERTLELVSDLTHEQLTVPMMEVVNPFRWELGHVAFFYDVFLLRALDSGALLLKGAENLYDSFKVDHDDRWGLPLPSREETLAYLQRVLERVARRLESRDPDGKESYLHSLSILHEDMHGEAFTYMRQTLEYPQPRPGSRRPARRARRDRAMNGNGKTAIDAGTFDYIVAGAGSAGCCVAARLSENGRYRIPNDNPFVSVPGARKEIWAHGFRNPHRLNWAVDPANPANNRLIANSVGLHTWETVYIVHKGENHGYGEREGTELLKPDNTTGPLPADDRIPVRIGAEPTGRMVVPIYPVIQYGHDPKGGDAIGSGFVYNGKAIPSLRGKYLFTDLTTGRIWYADYKDMLAADDGKPGTLATIREVRVRWADKVYDDMFPVVETTYQARGGKSPKLPPRPDFVKGARSDVRFAIDADGELYLYSKGDGMIRKVVGATGFTGGSTAQD